MSKEKKYYERNLPQTKYATIYFQPTQREEIVTTNFHPLIMLDAQSGLELWSGFVHENGGVFYERFWLNEGEVQWL